ncbi:MAG: hypothetical protein ABIS69_05160 [Sediminibacterium sp.]
MNGKIDMRKVSLSKEILQFSGTLNHLAANMNQVAKKRNQNEDLNAIERANLQQGYLLIKQLAIDIKNRFNDRQNTNGKVPAAFGTRAKKIL